MKYSQISVYRNEKNQRVREMYFFSIYFQSTLLVSWDIMK